MVSNNKKIEIKSLIGEIILMSFGKKYTERRIKVVFKTPGTKFVTHPLFNWLVGIRAIRNEKKIEFVIAKLFFRKIKKKIIEFIEVKNIEINLANWRSVILSKKNK